MKTKKDLIPAWLHLIESKDKEISNFKERADELTDYAVEIRYPDDYYVEPSIVDAKEAFQIAREIKKYVLSKIKL
jgi:HEPN domain-containing protein